MITCIPFSQAMEHLACAEINKKVRTKLAEVTAPTLSVEQLSESTGISQKQLRDWLKKKRIPGQRRLQSGGWEVEVHEFSTWIRSLPHRHYPPTKCPSCKSLASLRVVEEHRTQTPKVFLLCAVCSNAACKGSFHMKLDTRTEEEKKPAVTTKEEETSHAEDCGQEDKPEILVAVR